MSALGKVHTRHFYFYFKDCEVKVLGKTFLHQSDTDLSGKSED